MSGILSDNPPMVIGASIISFVSLIIHIIGFSTTYWYQVIYPTGQIVGHFGLWESCSPMFGEDHIICTYFSDIPVHNANITITEIAECIALAAFIAAFISALLKMFVLKDIGMIYCVAGFLNLLAGGIALIGVIVFATLTEFRGIQVFSGFKLHYSFGLCIVGGIGGVFSGIIFILAWRWVRN